MDARSERAIEAELVARCMSGDEEAWRQFSRRYKDYVKHHIVIMLRRRGGDPELADEIEQGVWESLIPSKGHLRTYVHYRGGLKAFLAARAEQVLFVYLRSENRRQTKLAAVSKAPEELVVLFDTSTTDLGDFLSVLSPRQREFCEARLLDRRTPYVGPARSADASRKMTQRILERFLAFQRAG